MGRNYFSDAGDFVADVVQDDLGGDLLKLGALASGGTLPLALMVGSELYNIYKNQTGDGDGPASTAKTEEELIKELAASESAAGEEAMYLRKQAMMNNVL